MKTILHDANQTIDAPAQVGVPAGDADMLYLVRVEHAISPHARSGATNPGRSRGLLPRPRSDCAEQARGLLQVPALLKQGEVRKE